LAIALLVQDPRLGVNLVPQPALQFLKMAGIELLVRLLDLTRNQTLNSAQLLEYYRDTEDYPILTKLAQWDHQVADDNVQQEFKTALVWLNNQYIEQRYQELSLKQNLTKEEKLQLTKLIAAMKRS
jgi:DNA primase